MGAAESVRTAAYGEARRPTVVDRVGVWLSGRAVRRHAELAGARVADLGCGYQATFARSVLDDAASALLIDVSLAPDLARNAKVEAIEAPLEDALPGIATASLDVVLCLSVLEHLREPQSALGHLHRILAPGGVALLNVPSWTGKRFLELSAFRLGLSPAEEMDDHKRYYDPRDLWPMLVRAGFMPSGIRVRRHKFRLNTFAVCRRPAGDRR